MLKIPFEHEFSVKVNCSCSIFAICAFLKHHFFYIPAIFHLQMPAFEIPTFTVTINPLESNEITFVPGSPPSTGETSSLEHQPLLVPSSSDDHKFPSKSIANTTIIVDDEVVNNKLLLGSKVHNPSQFLTS